MPIRIATQEWPKCTYRVRYAEARDSILRLPGWHKHRHRLWTVDVGPLKGMVRVNGTVYRRSNSSVGVYAPGTVYEENMEVGRLVSWAWLLIEEDGTPSLLKKLTGDAGFCIFSIKRSGRLPPAKGNKAIHNVSLQPLTGKTTGCLPAQSQ